MLNSISRLGETRPEQEWSNGVEFSGYSEVHPKFRNEIPENVCSIRSQTRNFRNFWSNGKRPCRISYVGGLGTSRCIMGLTTQDPYIQKEHTELYKILLISFMLIGPILNKIQPFKNFKICKEMHGFPDRCPQNVWIRQSIHLLLNF